VAGAAAWRSDGSTPGSEGRGGRQQRPQVWHWHSGGGRSSCITAAGTRPAATVGVAISVMCGNGMATAHWRQAQELQQHQHQSSVAAASCPAAAVGWWQR